ncbi:hypothetical protein Vadar_013400 [Vaccinium darrowii]|uniref:Uncharacterized protein n=1 Tax=Vaccinium darrowii TaxID=229202 RepID=A0ACB7X9N3_9ERIC|nr:hypothetical protein Vadar_013400 [Vaccinium darrowii]
MDTKNVMTCILAMVLVMGFADSDIDKDREECGTQLVGLSTCLSYVGGLPSLCHAPANISDCPALLNLAPNSPDAKVFEDFANSSKGSNSTTATATGSNSATTGSSADAKSEGGRGKRWLMVEMACVVMTSMAVHMLVKL